MQAGGSGELAAQVNDAAGRPIGGAPVRFSAEDPRALRVDADGTVVSLGGPTGVYIVVAASGARSKEVAVHVSAGTPHHLEKISGDGQSFIAGEVPAQPLVVRAVDAWGNPVPNAALEFSSAATQPPASSLTGAEGLASITPPSLERAGSSQFTVRLAGRPELPATFDAQVSAAAPATLDGSARAPAEAAATGDVALELRVRDTFGNPVPGVELRLVEPREFSGVTAARTDALGNAVIELTAVPLRGRRRPGAFVVAAAAPSALSARLSFGTNGAGAGSSR